VPQASRRGPIHPPFFAPVARSVESPRAREECDNGDNIQQFNHGTSPRFRENHLVPILLKTLRKSLRRSWPPAFLAAHDNAGMRPQEEFQSAHLVAT
jgi:hypothetical protein